MGRPWSLDTAYAREIGLMGKYDSRKIKLLGGADKLKAMDEDCRAVLIKANRGGSKELIKGGLRARGMRRAQDIRTQE